MKVFNNYKLASKYTKNSILVIGNLDGVHKGHQRIIKSAKNIAKKNNTRVGILLFNPHPRKYFESNKNGFLLTDLDSRFKILKDQKVDYVVILGFNPFSLSSKHNGKEAWALLRINLSFFFIITS